MEIPSTEGPRCLEAVLEEKAGRLDVPVHRVSQGSGVFLLTDEELDEMVAMAHSARCEVSLFARPNAGWDASATARAPRARSWRRRRAARSSWCGPSRTRGARQTTASDPC